MKTTYLSYLRPGQEFTSNRKNYTVKQQEENMVEVSDGTRSWAFWRWSRVDIKK